MTEVRTAAVPFGDCLSGRCRVCPGQVGPSTWADPARKGATYTTPKTLCPHKCHTRDLPLIDVEESR